MSTGNCCSRPYCESTHFLDNVVSANAYVPSVPEVAEAAYRARRIGLGIMGLGDMMYKMGIRYGSEEGQEFAAQVMEFVRFHTHAEEHRTCRRARAVSLPSRAASTIPNRTDGMAWQPPQPVTPYTRDWGRPTLDWQADRRRHQPSTASATQPRPPWRPPAPSPQFAAVKDMAASRYSRLATFAISVMATKMWSWRTPARSSTKRWHRQA